MDDPPVDQGDVRSANGPPVPVHEVNGASWVWEEDLNINWTFSPRALAFIGGEEEQEDAVLDATVTYC